MTEAEILIRESRRIAYEKQEKEKSDLINGRIKQVDDKAEKAIGLSTKALDGLKETNRALESTTELSNEAIRIAKETSKQKGEKGEKGENGKDGKDGKSIKGDKGENGMDGKDGKNGIGINGEDGKPGKNGTNGKDGKDGSPDTPIEIRDKLSSLRGNNRLDAKNIKNISDYVTFTVTQMDRKNIETDPIYLADKPNIALKSEIPTKTSDLTNDSGFISEETDPVWNSEKASYVPYTGATTDVNLGNNELKVRNGITLGQAPGGFGLYSTVRDDNGLTIQASNGDNVSANGEDLWLEAGDAKTDSDANGGSVDIYLGSKDGTGNNGKLNILAGEDAQAIFDLSKVSGNQTYYLPNRTGIIALTNKAVAIKSGNYTLTEDDEVVTFTATATATLPATSGSGLTYRIICRTGTLTIIGSGSDTIKGEVNQVLYSGEDLILTDTETGIWE